MTIAVLSNIIAGNISPLKKSFLERSFYLKKFVFSLEEALPQLDEGKSLFYFDVVSHGPTQGLFDTFLATGAYTEEIALAQFYTEKEARVKVARDYNELINEYRKGIYKNVQVFFYDIDKNLHNLSPYFSSESDFEQPEKIDLSQTEIRIYGETSYGNELEIKSNKIFYESAVMPTKPGSKGANDILEINLENFNLPSYKPVQLEIKLKANKLISAIHNYPYLDSSFSQLPKEYYLADLQADKILNSLLNYILERERFRKIAQVSSKGDEYPYDVKNITDGDLETSWIQSKEPWGKGNPAWLEISLPAGDSFSEVRWISAYQARLPSTYEYQTAKEKDGPWQTIFSVKNRKIRANEYVVDKIPSTTAKFFRMIIHQSSDGPPSISELELLKTASNSYSEQANLLMDYPLVKATSKNEAEKIVESLQDYLKIKVYPISDKYLHKNQSPAVKSNIIVNGRSYTYSFILPAGGTKIKSILIEFPKIPLSAEISSLTLKQIL